MVDLSRLMQDAAILEVIEQSADECRALSAQNSYQAMRIEELERKLSEARAALEEARKEAHRRDVSLVEAVYGQPCPTPDQWGRMQEVAAKAFAARSKP